MPGLRWRGKPRVVLVHPDPQRGDELALTLRSAGMEVFVFIETAAALSRAGKGADAVVIEVGAAGAGGGAFRAFHQDPAVAGAPLLALSEKPLPEEAVGEVLAAGASDILLPPVRPALLLARVRTLVQVRVEEARLAETESRHHRLFASSHNGYFLSTRAGRFLEVNDAMVQMLGYADRAELMRLRLPNDLYADPRDRAVFQALIERQGFVKDFKVNFRRKDGTPAAFLLTASLYRAPDGSVGYEGVNTPLEDLRPPRWLRLMGPLAPWVGRHLVKQAPMLAVSRASELVAERYERTEEMAESHYSSVWKGRDILKLDEEPLVLKMAKSEAVNPRFLLEARALQALAGHTGVPRLVAVARHRKRVVLVTRFIEGKPLSEAMDGLDSRGKDRAAWQLLDVVAHLHEHDIVHRDIKPENVMVRPDGRLVLVDFGISRALGELETSATVIGTYPYMSPEQIQGKSERRTDVWGLGVVLYRLYAGRLPFAEATDLELMNAILERDPPPPRSLDPAIPRELEAIILRALRKDPEGRFPSAGQMRDAAVANVPGFAANVADLLPPEEPFTTLVP